MKYRRDKYGQELSRLGFGCMRFERSGGKIDLPRAEAQIMEAYALGCNYYDTAYIYPGSEAALGEILKKNGIREEVKIATKLPQYLVNSNAALNRYFEEELTRLQTDYVDYYLMHHLTDLAQWERLIRMGILDWIAERKASGQIRNIGFSYHGNTANFLKILNSYDWDMCQIQYNYMDEVSQAGTEGLRAAYAKGIPVVIMEPLRGGKLVNLLPAQAREALAAQREWSPAEWGLRWLYSQEEVSVVLSGMNTLEMVRENCRVADESAIGEMTQEDLQVLERVKEIIRAGEKVGCTGCRYCMPCPKGVDIPGIFRCYNVMYTEGKRQGRFEFAQTVGLTREPSFATQCIGCGKCEKKCPQGIAIREKLQEADRELRPWPYKAGIGAVRLFMFRGMKTNKK